MSAPERPPPFARVPVYLSCVMKMRFAPGAPVLLDAPVEAPVDAIVVGPLVVEPPAPVAPDWELVVEVPQPPREPAITKKRAAFDQDPSEEVCIRRTCLCPGEDPSASARERSIDVDRHDPH
jgi:hypothetical protein